jgi:hypothetical protein
MRKAERNGEPSSTEGFLSLRSNDLAPVVGEEETNGCSSPPNSKRSFSMEPAVLFKEVGMAKTLPK